MWTRAGRARSFTHLRFRLLAGGGSFGLAVFGVEPWKVAAALGISAVALIVLPPCEEAGQQLKSRVRWAMRRKRRDP